MSMYDFFFVNNLTFKIYLPRVKFLNLLVRRLTIFLAGLSGNMGAVLVIEKAEDLTDEIRSLPYGISKIIAVVDSRRFVEYKLFL